MVNLNHGRRLEQGLYINFSDRNETMTSGEYWIYLSGIYNILAMYPSI